MAASITGTFSIIDRASGPMKKMEAQAQKTMAAIESVGKANDKAAGNTSATRNMERTERTMRNLGREAKSAGAALGQTDDGMRKVDRSSGGLINKLGRLGGAFMGVKAIMMGMMFGAVGVAVTALAQAIGVLAGGAVALVPALASASSVIAALPATLGAAIQGFVGFKAAMSGVSAAVKAGVSQQKQAGRTATDMADQQRAAAQAIASAQHGVMMAARGVRNAEEGLVLAHRNTMDATKQLTEARREARRELVDMDMAQKRAALGARGADLNLRAARDRLAQMAIDPQSTELDMMQQQLSVEEAVLGRREARVQSRRSRADNRRTQGKGVGRNDQVIQAMRGIQDAQRGVRDASEGVEDALYAQGQAARALADAQRQANRLTTEGSSASQAYADALKELPPAARAFAMRLVGLRSTMKGVQAAAAEGLFPGLNSSLTSALKTVPLVERTMRRTGRAIGGNMAAGMKDLTTGDRLGDMEKLGTHQAKILGRMVRAFFNLGEALMDFMMAARPFTNWLTRTIEGWTEAIALNAKFGRETGSTAAKLDRARDVLERFGRILGNLWGTLRGVGRAARPLGERLWDGAERATEGWERYANSVDGARKMRKWFDALYPALHELGQLTKDLAQAWARITVDPAFVQTVQALRKTVPAIERLMTSLSGLGPAAVDALTAVVELLAALPLSPLTLLLKTFTKLVQALTWLTDNIPGLGVIMSGLITARLLGSVGRYAMKVSLIAKAWAGVRTAIMGTAVAQGLVAGGGAAGTAAGGLGGAVLGGGAGRFAGLTAKNVGKFALRGLGPAGVAYAAADLLIPEQRRQNHLPKKYRERANAGMEVLAPKPTSLYEAVAPGFGETALGVFNDAGKHKKAANSLLGIEERVKALHRAGNGAGLRNLGRELEDISRDLSGDKRKLIEDYATDVTRLGRGAQRSAVMMRNSNIAGQMMSQLGGVTRVTRRSVRGILSRLDDLSPGARKKVTRQLLTMMRTMEDKGLVPINSTKRLRKQMLGALDGLESGARTRTRKMVRAITGALKAGIRTLFPQVGALGDLLKSATDPKDTGIGRRELARRFISRGGMPKVADALLGPRNKAERRDAKTLTRTPAQIKVFQGRHGLAQDGRIGRDTQRAAREEGLFLKQRTDTNKKVAASHKRTTWDVRRTENRSTADLAREGRRKRTNVNETNSAILSNTQKKWAMVKAGIASNAKGAQREADTSFTKLVSQAMGNLAKLGIKGSEATKLIQGGGGGGGESKGGVGGSSGQGAAYRALGGRVNYAGGGRIPGVGLQDTVPVGPGHLAAPGELIVNRHTENRINQRLRGKTTLGKEVAAEGTPHSAPPKRAATGLRLALGPYAIPPIGYDANHAGGNSHLHVAMETPALAKGLAAKLQTKGWQISEATWAVGGVQPGIHASPEHYDGRAFDANTGADESKAEVAAAAALISTGKYGGGGAGAFPGGGGGTAVEAMKALKVDPSGLPGIGGAMSNRARRLLAKGMTAKINKRLGAQGGGGGPGGPLARGPNGKKIFDYFMRAGFTKNQSAAWVGNFMQESGLNPAAVQAGGPGRGLAQWGDGRFTALQQFASSKGTPWTNLKTQLDFVMHELRGSESAAYASIKGTRSLEAAVNAIGADYERFGIAGDRSGPARSALRAYGGKYAKGGRVPGTPDWGGWNARGGSFDVDRPTLFGAGEAGSERVTVTPKSGGGGNGAGGVNVTVHIDKIDYRRKGDIRQAVQRELEEVAEDLSRGN